MNLNNLFAFNLKNTNFIKGMQRPLNSHSVDHTTVKRRVMIYANCTHINDHKDNIA